MVEEGKVEMIRSVRGLAGNLFISKHSGEILHFRTYSNKVFPKLTERQSPSSWWNAVNEVAWQQVSEMSR